MQDSLKKNLRHFTLSDLTDELKSIGEPSFRAKQIWQWLWEKHELNTQNMNNLPKPLREKLEAKFQIYRMELSEQQVSTDGTIKAGFKLFDDKLVEGVLIPKDNRMTACISSQVGCSLDCRFCATAKLPRMRNLHFDEIFDQVAYLNKTAQQYYQQPLTNIVYMGMGEPLLNYRQVMESIDRITSPTGLGMSPKRITVSTAGIAKMIAKLADDKVKFRLALSLHAPNDEKRSKIMSINDTNNISVLKNALNSFTDATGSRVTLEYVMLKDYNDTDTDADELADFARSFASKINLIEYNLIEGGEFDKSSRNRMYAFKNRLEQLGVIANIRKSRGEDIDAACGQLANKSKEV
jgi:23S rRNA (adenine2503-C2)-methyltransferase